MRRLRQYVHRRHDSDNQFASAALSLASLSLDKDGISIHLPNLIHLSGCPIQGQVQLFVCQLREDNVGQVRLQLSGRSRTCITRSRPQATTTVLFHQELSLWTYDVPDDDPNLLYVTENRPFSFKLPSGLPPTLYHCSGAVIADIDYLLTVVRVRHGATHATSRVCVPLVVVPKDSPESLSAKARLLSGEVDEPKWKVVLKEKKIRRGLWGEYGTVRVRLMILDLPAQPLFVSVPFVIELESISPPLTRAKANSLPREKLAFPVLPRAFTTLDFRLRRTLRIRADTSEEAVSSDVAVFTHAAAVISAVRIDAPRGCWVPLQDNEAESHDGPGTWIERARFESAFRLACAPSFATDRIDCQYSLELTVPFPGAGNDVHARLPIRVGSGADAPLTREELGAPAPLDALAGFLDLPLLYWDANVRERDG